MVAKRFNSGNKIPTNLILLKNFDKSKLRITIHDCADRNVYHTD